MAYGRLNVSQGKVISDIVTGRIVHDLGSGDMVLSKKLLDLGAKKVVAIDVPDYKIVRNTNRNIEKVDCYFCDYKEPINIAFISWPSNYRNDLHVLAMRSNIVIYLGTNFDGSSCGYKEFFQELLRRELLSYVPAKENSLIVVGRSLPVPREPTPEEFAALDPAMKIRRYEDYQ